jgi:hypothetical protein
VSTPNQHSDLRFIRLAYIISHSSPGPVATCGPRGELCLSNKLAPWPPRPPDFQQCAALLGLRQRRGELPPGRAPGCTSQRGGRAARQAGASGEARLWKIVLPWNPAMASSISPEGRNFGTDHLEGPSAAEKNPSSTTLRILYWNKFYISMSTTGEGDQSTATQHASLPFVLSGQQLSSARNASVWTKTVINNFRKLMESRRDKAVNEELPNLYDILLVSVESEFDVAGEAVASPRRGGRWGIKSMILD